MALLAAGAAGAAALERIAHKLGTQAIVESFGYSVENHTVTTEDGYILRLFRVGAAGGRAPGTPVFIMHGLLSSSADWVAPGPGKAIPFLLADLGYDVWLGNSRGTTESRRSCKLDPDRDPAFWDFSWHEVGVHDLPSSINYALGVSNRTDLHYVGHSQGTTSFFVMASEVPGMMSKIRTAHLLAPVAFVKWLRSVVLRLASIIAIELWPVARMAGVFQLLEILPHSQFITSFADTFCKSTDATQFLCYEILFLIGGHNWEQQDKDMLPEYMANCPGGSSLKQFAHYGQLIQTMRNVFQQYDYGPIGNLQRYKTLWPPEYDLSRVTCNLTLVYGRNDYLAVKSNVDQIKRRVPHSAVVEVDHPKWNHFDFIIGRDVMPLVNDGIITRMRGFDGLQ